MRRVVIKDILWGAAVTWLIYIWGVKARDIPLQLTVTSIIIAAVIFWLRRKTSRQAFKDLINLTRVLQMPVIIAFLSLGVALYINRYNTITLMYLVLLISLAAMILSYVMLLNWTLVLNKPSSVNPMSYSKTMFTIAGLWWLVIGLLLFMSL